MTEERPKPKKRLYDFDFSVEGAEVSLVDKAANGHAFLLLKAESSPVPQHDQEAQGVSEESVIKNIDILRDALAQMFGISQPAPQPTAPVYDNNPLKQSMHGLLDMLGDYIRSTTNHEPVQARIIGGETYQEARHQEYLTEKSENSNMLLEDIIKSEEGQKLINELVEKAMNPLKQENDDLKKSLVYFQKVEEDKREQDFINAAKSLNKLGFTEEHGKLLKSICDKAPEEYASLSELLLKSISMQTHESMFEELGTSEVSETVDIDGIEKDIVAKSKELMKEDKSLTQPMAIAKALKIKHRGDK